MNDLTLSGLAIHGSTKMKNSLAEQHIIVMLVKIPLEAQKDRGRCSPAPELVLGQEPWMEQKHDFPLC
jgi:hypothetical protein